MNLNYYKISVVLSELHPWRDLLIYELGEILFESFENTENGLDAYVQENDFNQNAIDEVKNKYVDAISNLEIEFIKAQNWNANWESNFEPVIIDNQLVIKAPFHQLEQDFEHTIEIQPKMSFGTGHHQTTRLISSFLLNETAMPSDILDMGCGTGVLAIIAKKLGAKNVIGIDIEEWAYENSIENAERNACSDIQFYHGGEEKIPNQTFGLILANINKNILLTQMKTYFNHMDSGAQLVMSGFYQSDVEDLVTFGQELGFNYVKQNNIENWAMLVLKK